MASSQKTAQLQKPRGGLPISNLDQPIARRNSCVFPLETSDRTSEPYDGWRGEHAKLPELLSTRRHARNIHIRSPCWITNPAPGVSRGRGENTRVAWITAYSGTLPVMKRIASGSILSQCCRCDPHNSGKNSQDEERKPHGSLLFASPETPAPIIYFQPVNNEQFETQWCMRNLIRIKSDQARRIEVDVAGAIG